MLAALEEPGDPADKELEPGLGAPGHGLLPIGGAVDCLIRRPIGSRCIEQ